MLSKKAQSLKPSPTLAIAAKAKELAAQGHSVISLSVGEPDWDTFHAIKEVAIQAIQAGQTKYSPSNGTPQLRTAIAHKTEKLLGVKYSPNEVTVSAGAKFILFGALQMLCDPGDEVLIPAPYWVSYPTMVELVDGVPVIVPSDELTGFKPLASQISKYITPKTKVLILNSPNNPTGQMYTKEEIRDIGLMLKMHPNIVVISDDIYNQLVFDGSEVAPHLLHAFPDLKDRIVVVNGASKSYSMTGWRLGWALGPEPIIKAMSNYQSQTVSCAAPFTQAGALAGLQYCDDEIKKSLETLRERRDLFVEAINMVKGWRAGYPQGAFYVWADIRELLGRKYQGKAMNTSSDVAAAYSMPKKLRLYLVERADSKAYLRLSFALHENDLNEAVKRIRLFTDSV